MNEFLIGTEMDGTVVAIPLARVVYLRQGSVATEIYLEGGAVVRVQETIDGLGIGIYRAEEGSREEETGVAPPSE